MARESIDPLAAFLVGVSGAGAIAAGATVDSADGGEGLAAGDLVLARARGLDLTRSDLRLSKEKSCFGGGGSSKSGSS